MRQLLSNKQNTVKLFLCSFVLGWFLLLPPTKKKGGVHFANKNPGRKTSPSIGIHPSSIYPLSSQPPTHPGSHKAQRSLFSYPKLPSWERITYPTYPLPSLYHDFPNFPFGWDMWFFPSYFLNLNKGPFWEIFGELTYPLPRHEIEDDFPFPKVGYVSSLEGILKGIPVLNYLVGEVGWCCSQLSAGNSLWIRQKSLEASWVKHGKTMKPKTSRSCFSLLLL